MHLLRACIPYWTIVLPVLAVLESIAAPTSKINRAAMPPQLDGVSDDACWEQTPWQSDFVSASVAAENAGQPKPVDAQTRFKVVYDNAALYVAVECDEPKIGNLRANATGHDTMVFMDDCVELFMDPAGDGRYYHHFIVNSNGAWYDDYGADYGLVHNKLWDCPLEAVTKVDTAAKRWRAEVRIPFAALLLRSDAGADWLWNVARERYAGGQQELSTWSPLKGSFHSPKLFGKLTGIHVDYSAFAVGIGEPTLSVSGGAGNDRALHVNLPVVNSTATPLKLKSSVQLFGKAQTAVEASAVDIPARSTSTVSFPPFMVPRSEKTVQAQFTLVDMQTGAPCKVVVKELSSEYRPLAIDIIQPVYRNNIYATQSIPQLVFRVALSADVRAGCKLVTFRLLDEQGKSVREGKTAVDGLALSQKLEVGTLPVGKYALTVQAASADGTPLAESQETVCKLPPAPGNEVRIDEHRNLLVNGKPKVFIGWYGNIHLEDPRPDVVALQDLVTPVVVNYPNVEPLAKSYREHGIYSIVSVEPGRLFYSFNLWQKPCNPVQGEPAKLLGPSDECLGYVKQLIEVVQNQPGLLGDYLADEPEINNTRSDYLETFYKMMQELDPYHPVMITNDTLDGIVTHGYKACDILSPDPYSDNYDYVPNFMKKALEVASVGKTTMMTPWQSSGQAHFTHDYGTSPAYPYRVTRNQYLVAVAYGCRGFTGYTDAFYMSEPVLRYGLPPIWREVRFLEPAMGAPAPAELLKVEADAEMASWIREANGKLYLIVLNHKPGSRKARISHSLLTKIAALDVVSEGRQVTLKGGVFEDQFSEGDARIYTTDPAGRKLRTTAAVEKDIAAQEAASAKPGNLLHSTRGVCATASPGYFAPWFHQFYYYAINGITDDTGWHLTHGKLPQWLELTLPKAEKIGRVVIYTPNLRDYDLRFFDPDTGMQTAEIRGNHDAVAVHNFDPPIPTLKLRITAVATREGTEPVAAMVREIEAYPAKGAGPLTSVRQSQASVQPPPATADPTIPEGTGDLWVEDFAHFTTAEKLNWDGHDDKWVLNPQNFRAEPKPGGGITCTCTTAVGYAPMSHFFPYDPAYRFLQVKIASIEGEGYKFGNVIFGDSSGKPGTSRGINTNKPGIYTMDTHYVHEMFAQGTATKCYISVFVAGSAKKDDGTVKPGPKFTFGWLRLTQKPPNGLTVTLPDGSPLPNSLKEGDKLLYRLYLEAPAKDATVEVLTRPNHLVLPVNGEPYVQLARVGGKDGREWAATVKLGAGTGKYDGSTGYPVLFRARLTGGPIGETYACVSMKIE